jgi:hypothetical protein
LALVVGFYAMVIVFVSVNVHAKTMKRLEISIGLREFLSLPDTVFTSILLQVFAIINVTEDFACLSLFVVANMRAPHISLVTNLTTVSNVLSTVFEGCLTSGTRLAFEAFVAVATEMWLLGRKLLKDST